MLARAIMIGRLRGITEPPVPHDVPLIVTIAATLEPAVALGITPRGWGSPPSSATCPVGW